MAKKNKPGGKDQTASAVALVKLFLTHTIDKPDEKKAKALLSAATLAGGAFHLTPEIFGARYTVAEPRVEKGQLWIPVAITSASEGGASQTITLFMAPVQEDGQWKLDMTRTMQRMMGGMEAVVDQMAQAVGQVMEGVGEAIATGLQGLGSSSPDSTAPPIDSAALEKFQTDVLRQAEKDIHDQIDVNLPLDVDFTSLLTAPDEDGNRRLLGILQDRVFSNWFYWIREVNEKISLQDRVKAIRFEGVSDPCQRVIFAEGARIIYRLNLAGEAGFYKGEDLGRILTGVAAGMAESAPPADVSDRGTSYRPSGDAPQIIANYQEFVLPALTVRIAEMLGHELTIDIDWDLFNADGDDVAGLWLWGVNRVCGAIGLLMAIPGNRATRDDWNGGLTSVHIVPMPGPEHRAVRMEGNVLNLFIDPSAGEAGCFYESDIADAISQALKLRLRPMMAELERYAKSWEASLEEIFGRPIKFAFDFDTFSGHPDESKSIFALTMLREHGIDTMYYALRALAEKNPNFKQQVPKRVAWIYLDSVRPEDKGVHGEKTTIVNHVFLFEGYNGYLTQKELEARLPAIVAGMPDQDWDTPAAPESTLEPAAEPTAEAHVSYGVPEPDSEPEDAEAQAFASMQSQIQAMLPVYANQLQLTVGRALPLEIAWDTLGNKVEAVGQLLNAGLTPVLGGLGMLGQDPAIRDAIAKRVDKIVLRKSDTLSDHGFSLDDRILTFAAVLSPTVPTMDPQTAANLLRALFASPAAKSAAKKTAARKSPAESVPAKSPTPRTPASKKAKAAPKKAALKKPVPQKKRW